MENWNPMNGLMNRIPFMKWWEGDLPCSLILDLVQAEPLKFEWKHTAASNLTDLPHSLSSAHVYSSCVAWSCDWTGIWGCTKTWRPNLSTLSRWHWSFTKPNSDKSRAWRQSEQTFLDLEMFSNVHLSSHGDLHYLVGYCYWFSSILGYPQLYWGVRTTWSSLSERWPECYGFDGEHWNSWLGSHVAVPHCTNCTHSLGRTFFVPQLGGRRGDTKLNRSRQRSHNSIPTVVEEKIDKLSLIVEGVPPAIRVSWIASHH